ncbi:MAG: hypothetical protein LBB66_04405 [Desulfovibrio sp.]|nr:hypothetical protein [Desulfovibrio sp.]
MNDQEFAILQKSLTDIQVLLLAGFSSLAGYLIAETVEWKAGKASGAPNCVSELHGGLETVLGMLRMSRSAIEGLRQDNDGSGRK